MKKAIIYYKNSDNIGDDIQTYAAMKLLGDVDYILDRENLNQKNTIAETKLLCNGWFMKNPQNWPPHPNLNPLFISLYIDHKHGCHNLMLNPILKNYYQKNAPIGCRDKNTLDLFRNRGIEAYFSGCVTLTLPEYHGERNDEILLVDPFVKIFDPKYVKTQIKRMIPSSVANNVSVLTHHDFKLKNLSIEKRLEQAEKLLHRYAKAKLIITSRIHCGLPATAMGTPVYFMDVGYDRQHAKERLNGLLDLFKVIGDQNFPASSNQPFTKLKRKLGIYPKKPISTALIDFKMETSTQEKFKPKFDLAQRLSNDIKSKVTDFFQ